MICAGRAGAWQWWYAQYVDGYRRDVTVVAMDEGECLYEVIPRELGWRPVYAASLTEPARQGAMVFFPARGVWRAVAWQAPLVDGALLKGSDERIYLLAEGQRRWVPSIEVFSARGFDWSRVQLTSDDRLRGIPEGLPLTANS